MTAQSKIEPSIMSALAKALPELEGAKKNSANPHFKSKYADLGAVIDAIRPIAAHARCNAARSTRCGLPALARDSNRRG